MTSDIKIRTALPKDDLAVGELLVNAFVATYSRKMPHVIVTPERKATLRDVAGKREAATVLVAESPEPDEKIIGTVALYPPGAAGSEAWLPRAADLRHLAVDPLYHGTKVGSALLDETEKIARAWRVQAICLHVRRGAHGLARMYQRRGYVRAPEGDLELPTIYLEGFVCLLES